MTDILRWKAGAGWLVFSGGRDALGDMRAMALTRVNMEGSVAYIGLDDDDDEDVIEDMAELGAPTGYLVNVMTEDDESIRQQLAAAALIVLPDELDVENLRLGLLGAAVDGMQSAYERGAIIFAEGPSAMLFGKVARTGPSTAIEGLEWLEDAVIVPDVVSISESYEAMEILGSKAANIAVGIGVGSALALGPYGQVEIWGEKQVTLTLGTSAPDES